MTRVLFFTNSDYGQANVVLATAHALAHVISDVEIHIASFQGLQEAVRATSDFALSSAPKSVNAKPFIFHEVKGISWGPATFRPETGVTAGNDLTPGLVNSAKVVSLIPAVMLPWRPEEFIAIYREAERVLEEVKPDITVVDPIFTPGLTLCHHLNVNWMVLAPNTIKDFALPSQPGLAMLWKYPFVCSAISYPVPWSLIPRNIFLNLVAGYALLTDGRIKSITQLLRKEVSSSITLMTANELGVLKAPPPGLRVLVAISRDIDYPMSVLPPHVIPCGPIVRAVPPIASVDPELAEWLSKGPTVYVNLGTHLKADPVEAGEMARAFKSILGQAGELYGGKDRKPLQILWKLGRKLEEENEKLERDVYEGPWEAVVDVLGSEMKADRVRITDWVKAEPKSVLESGHVVCSINHGGASSFYEAMCAGVPQVTLPPWSDTYDFANRVELLGIGRWGSKAARPRWEQKELTYSLNEVLFGTQAESIIAKARELASKHPESAGREKAAREILACIKA